MQYLREDVVNQACMVRVRSSKESKDGLGSMDMEANQPQLDAFGATVSMIVYENTHGKVTIGNIEPQTKLQTRRVTFRKQVNKAIMIRGEDLVLASIEEPDFGFVDPDRPDARNTVALLSKQSFKTLDTHELERYELATSVHQIEKKVSGAAGSHGLRTSFRN